MYSKHHIFHLSKLTGIIDWNIDPGIISDTLYYQSIHDFLSATYYYACGTASAG